MIKILLIQENGRHNENRHFRECFCLQRGFEKLGHNVTVWGLGHDNFNQKIDFELGDFDEIIIEYDSSDGRLYVDTTFFGPSLTMFGYGSKEKRKELFSDWFEYYEGIKPNFVDVTI